MTYGVCCRVEKFGTAITISSGGRVCSRRQRRVGSRLSIRSGSVESPAAPITSTFLMTGSPSAVNRPETRVSIKAAFIFLAVFTLYFISRSPGLDEIDSVNFAMGVGHFNLWQHQPHPPGYPLYIFLGWLGVKLFSASPES